jgi:hypothetical protein
MQRLLDQRGFVYRRRDIDLLFPLRGQGSFEGFWGRVEIVAAPGRLANFKELAMNFSFWPEDEHSVVPTNTLPIEEFLALLESVPAPSFAEQVMIASGTFLLDTQHWRSAVTLPVQLPDVLNSPSGTPEITGFEFMFREPTSELKRAEISLPADGDELSIEMMVLISPLPSETLIQRACHLLAKHLGLLAVRLTSAEVPTHV